MDGRLIILNSIGVIMMGKVLMLYGINYNMFGKRNFKIYGFIIFDEINESMF